jgi:hypothetical protein
MKVAGLFGGIGGIAAGRPDVVIDRKSGVAPSPTSVEGYAGQVRRYLKPIGARRGLIVFMPAGTVIEVAQ